MMTVYLSVGVAATSTTVTTGLVLYRWLRPKFPVTVTCWFCHRHTKVPYGNKNCWDCPNCDQYNGFNEDGDYNKPIPAQHEEYFNEPLNQTRSDDYVNNCSLFKNGFCKECNANQQMKISALTHFVPLNEDNYDEELSDYKTYLERVYRLCRKCEVILRDTLGQQDSFLRPKLLAWRSKRNSSSSSTKSSIFENAFIKKVYSSSTVSFYFYLLSFFIFLFTTILEFFQKNLISFNANHEWIQLVLPSYILVDSIHLVHNLGYEISLIFFVIGIISKKFNVYFVDLLTLLLHLTHAILNSQFAIYFDYYLNSTNEEIVRYVILFSTLTFLLWTSATSRYPKRSEKYFTKSCIANKSKDTSTSAWIQNKIKTEKQHRKRTKENLQTSLGAMSIGTPRKSNKSPGIFTTHEYSPVNYLTEESRLRRPILSPPRLISPQPYSPWPFTNCWQQPQQIWSPASPTLNGRMNSSPTMLNFSQFHENGNLFTPITANNGFYCPSYPSSRVGSIYGCDEPSFYDHNCHNYNCVSPQDMMTQSYESNLTRKRGSEKGTNSTKSSASTCPVDTTTKINLSGNEPEPYFCSWQKIVLALSIMLNAVAAVAAIFMLKDNKLKFAVI